ncbi:helix-turn-helix domain-containing protein [Leptospira licerasiae]|uniref:DNA-binding helix-turn-helix protein n=1 Tax=Leptospira licerasiae str. MMD4847 TaxID=1049971 RepID=A0ABN0HED4_9LEPT|nr:helix-turn-helix transcriptional regulator [Leptospira licerasiae]EIE01253.1 DNA-binding helix-turn-helix protein [Leptospira licerasiae serovar Varillal str. VAR 010]EJZ43996.1 DNA-binding helix-turn-helix protein [Leptospira licerasiae str. MMD4847]
MKVTDRQKKNFLKSLKQARIEAGFTQIQVAEQIGTSQSFISKVESGRISLEVEIFLKLYQLYDKPAVYFFSPFSKK